jgi:hypothetical protein
MDELALVDLGLRQPGPDPERLVAGIVRQRRHLAQLVVQVVSRLLLTFARSYWDDGPRALDVDPRADVAMPSNARGILRPEDQPLASEPRQAEAGRDALVRVGLIADKRRILAEPGCPRAREKRLGSRIAEGGGEVLCRDRRSPRRGSAVTGAVGAGAPIACADVDLNLQGESGSE